MPRGYVTKKSIPKVYLFGSPSLLGLPVCRTESNRKLTESTGPAEKSIRDEKKYLPKVYLFSNLSGRQKVYLFSYLCVC